jgi:hypothetical protein
MALGLQTRVLRDYLLRRRKGISLILVYLGGVGDPLEM